MKTIQALALLGAVLITACSERQATTAPTADVATVAPAGVIGDRPYTWSMKCSGNFSSYANWSWTSAGDTIAGYSLAVLCDPLASPIGAGGTRPAAADGFKACVNRVCKVWTFDPASSFKVQLKGYVSGYLPYCSHGQVCKVTYDGTLTIDS